MTHEFTTNPEPQGEQALVALESQSFVHFDLWMDARLDELVAQWIHTAAPNAERISRSSFGRGTAPSASEQPLDETRKDSAE